MTYHYAHAILGGTFDHLHAGHEKFISAALSGAQRVTIGLVQEPFTVEKAYPKSIESYAHRESSLDSYLAKINASSRSTIIPLSDIYGTSLTDPTIEAIYVTEATHRNAQRINVERAKLGLPQLDVITVDYVQGDDGVVVSSSRIRGGEIDHQGHSHLKFFRQKSIYHLPNSLRVKLQTPLGPVVTSSASLAKIISPDALLVSVGDIVSLDLVKARYHPAICIIDHRTRRHNLDRAEITKYFPFAHHTLVNPAGTINTKFGEIFLTSLSSFQNINPAGPAQRDDSRATQLIAVEGEEDLLALPALLLAPLDSYVIYGQYNVGMCLVKVTEEIKSIAKSYLAQFT